MAMGEFALSKKHLEEALAGPDVSQGYFNPAAENDLYDLMAVGEFALIKRHLEEALAGPDVSPSYINPAADHDFYSLLVDVAALQEDAETLGKVAPLAEASAVDSNHILYLAIAHRAFGVLHRLNGNYQESEERLRNALDLFRQLETRWQIGRTLFELGKLAREQNENALAQNHFRGATKNLEALGALPDAARVQAVLSTI
jgi:tetratricopeptide (TPR) repeat protein